MDAVEFLKEAERMCKSVDRKCSQCKIDALEEGNGTCWGVIREHPEEAVAIVEQWSKDHPCKTRQSEFLKLFPKAKVDADCVITICPYETCIRYKCDLNWGESTESKCRECRKKYWLEEIEAD